MEALDILEKRIDTIARLVGPIESLREAENSNTTVVDSIISVQSLIDGALKGRDQINKALERTPELEKYLDPDYINEVQKGKAKEVYITAIAPELQNTFEQLEQIKSLEPTLGAEYFRNIPTDESTDKLKRIHDENIEFAQQSEFIEESLILAMKRYGEIQDGLMKKLDDMKKRLEVIEEKIENQKRTERETPME